MIDRDEIDALRDRVEELERQWSEFRENEWARVESSLRGLDNWLADQSPIVTVADVTDAVIVALGGSVLRRCGCEPKP